MTWRVSSTLRWYEMPGVVAAYQAVGAPGYDHSVQNVGRGMLGMYTVTPGVAPTWNATTGWICNNSRLFTGITPAIAWSALIRFSGVAAGASGYLFGDQNLTFYIRPANSLNTVWGNSGTLTLAGATSNGILGFANKDAFRDGVSVGVISPGSSTKVALKIADYADAGFRPLTGNIQSILISSITLSAAVIWQVTQQMQYCEYNPAWNAWAPQRRWFIPPSVAAGAVGVYGVRHSLALPGGVRIEAVRQ